MRTQSRLPTNLEMGKEKNSTRNFSLRTRVRRKLLTSANLGLTCILNRGFHWYSTTTPSCLGNLSQQSSHCLPQGGTIFHLRCFGREGRHQEARGDLRSRVRGGQSKGRHETRLHHSPLSGEQRLLG